MSEYTMRNAKEELSKEIGDKKILCARIVWGDWDTDKRVCILKPKYSKKDFEAFMDSLDFRYDAGYGSQELFGIVLFTDRSWLERHEYDGAECWHYKKCPTVTEIMGKGG
jgi:hypothetical protein